MAVMAGALLGMVERRNHAIRPYRPCLSLVPSSCSSESSADHRRDRWGGHGSRVVLPDSNVVRSPVTLQTVGRLTDAAPTGQAQACRAGILMIFMLGA